MVVKNFVVLVQVSIKSKREKHFYTYE